MNKALLKSEADIGQVAMYIRGCGYHCNPLMSKTLWKKICGLKQRTKSEVGSLGETVAREYGTLMSDTSQSWIRTSFFHLSEANASSGQMTGMY